MITSSNFNTNNIQLVQTNGSIITTPVGHYYTSMNQFPLKTKRGPYRKDKFTVKGWFSHGGSLSKDVVGKMKLLETIWDIITNGQEVDKPVCFTIEKIQ